MNNTIIRNNISNVNDFHDIFLNFVNKIKYGEDKAHAKNLEFKELLKPLKNLVPSVLYGYVLHIIKTQYRNDPLAYISTIPMFFDKFTRKDRLICDEAVSNEDKKKNREYKRKKKNLLLWAAQLLKLMGGKTGRFFRSAILCNTLVDIYKEEMQKTDDFIAQHRLISGNGQVVKLIKQSEKQKQKIAQILKISSVLSQIAKDKKFTYSLVTLTLPPIFHSNPTLGNECYGGATPKEAQHQLMKFWKRIRAQLAKDGYVAGEDFFGLETIECMKSSTLHLHALIYHSPYDTVAFHQIIKSVQDNYNKNFPIEIADTKEKKLKKNSKKYVSEEAAKENRKHRVKFDIKLNDGRASGATYVFKYITKTHSSYDSTDTNALKNTACRSFYGCRGFAFFGVQNCLTQFNFLVTNFINYKKFYNNEMRAMFETGDYYTFITKYCQYFENVYGVIDGSKKFLGVTFDTSATHSIKSKAKKDYLNKMKTQVLIQKKQYCIFELSQEHDTEFDSIEYFDLSLTENAGVSFAWSFVQQKQEDYNNNVNLFINQSHSIKIITINEEIYAPRKRTIGDYSNYTPLTSITSLEEEKQKTKNTTVVKLHLNNLIQDTAVLADIPKIEKTKIYPKLEEKPKITIKYQGFKLKR